MLWWSSDFSRRMPRKARRGDLEVDVVPPEDCFTRRKTERVDKRPFALYLPFVLRRRKHLPNRLNPPGRDVLFRED